MRLSEEEQRMSKQLELLAAVYADEERARTILDMLQTMHRADTITLADAALVMKGQDGKVQVQETRELTTRKGARRGAIIAGVIGLIYPPSLIASVLVGGGIGALAGKLRDTGVKAADLKNIADSLDAGKAAVVALVEAEGVTRAVSALRGYDGEVIRQALSSDSAAAVEQASAEGGSEPSA
jgi:uncharacterized membrane protein